MPTTAVNTISDTTRGLVSSQYWPAMRLSISPPPAAAPAARPARTAAAPRSEEHTSELQSLMRNSYAVFCLKQKTNSHYIHIVAAMNTPANRKHPQTRYKTSEH